MGKNKEFSEFLVLIQHKLSRTKENIVKFKGKFYKIKELG